MVNVGVVCILTNLLIGDIGPQPVSLTFIDIRILVDMLCVCVCVCVTGYTSNYFL